MNDIDCNIIIGLAVGHLIRCTFDDFRMSCLDCGEAFAELVEGLD